MTRDEIINMARDAGFPLRVLCPSGPCADMGEPLMAVVTRFAALVAAHELEELLDLVDSYAKDNADLKDAIRARAGKETK